MSVRVGFGFDIHRLTEGRRLILGGVEIPYVKGLLGHSDADVVLHAIGNALLGAIGAGDLGRHFPTSDPRWKEASSRRLVEEIMRMVARRRCRVENADVTVLAEEPRLEPFKPRMRMVLAELLRVSEEAVNVKASTYEAVGPIGRGEALAAYAVVSVDQRVANRQSPIARSKRRKTS